MRRISGLLFLLVISVNSKGGDTIVRPSRIKYINEHKDDAIRDMKRTGVPASITLAQACLESLDGNSALAKDANNHFGIKCSDWTGPSYIQDDDKKDECFRKYKTTLDSYDDHSLFLSTRPRYAFLFQLDKNDYKGWARGLKKAGYATDPAYADRLIKIIEDNQLYLLDQDKDVQFTASTKNEIEEPIAPKEIEIESSEPVNHKKIYVPSVESVDALGSRKIFSNNGIDYILARRGDNLKSLAREFKLGYWQLPKYNEMDSESELAEGQIIYIKPKKSEGLHTLYTVKPGDTISSIAQDNGIKSKFIFKYNDLPEGARVEPGQQIYLKKQNQSKS
jgi:LysM repeat protein